MTATMTDVTPWEQQKGESPPAFAAWQAYLAMGPTRTTRSVAAQLLKSDSIVRRWSSAWGWQERLRMWQNHQARVEQDERDERIREAVRQDERTAGAMLNLAIRRIVGDDNPLAPVAPLDPASFSPTETMRMVETSVKIRRQALGIADVPTEAKVKLEHAGEVNTGNDPALVRTLVASPAAMAAILDALDDQAGEPDPNAGAPGDPGDEGSS